jgi:hypothetical protein
LLVQRLTKKKKNKKKKKTKTLGVRPVKASRQNPHRPPGELANNFILKKLKKKKMPTVSEVSFISKRLIAKCSKLQKSDTPSKFHRGTRDDPCGNTTCQHRSELCAAAESEPELVQRFDSKQLPAALNFSV